ncbi:chromosome segregation protein [Actinophytocola sp.]|uniref:chromosome segregation protein n=1 Tax=Actinophytocola sp. TaxID=1872138 RepID=UPI00389A946A
MTDVQELVPLRTDFDIVLRGYRRGQVRRYVGAIEEELRLATADRDANASLAESLAAEIEQLRADNARLARQLDEMSRTPISPDAVPARLRGMVELAKEEAAEVIARAQGAAEHSWAVAEEAAGRLRTRYTDALADMDRARREMETEHRTLLQQARVDASVMTTEADRRRAELDGRAARRRAQVEADFEVAMARRRTEAMRELAEQKVAAEREASRLVGNASREATRLVDEAMTKSTRLVDEATTTAKRLVREATEESEHLIHDATAKVEVLLRDGTAEAERRVRAAAEEATRRISAADGEVDRLRELRGRMAAQLREARNVLAEVGPLLQQAGDAAPVEPAPIPEQRLTLKAEAPV